MSGKLGSDGGTTRSAYKWEFAVVGGSGGGAGGGGGAVPGTGLLRGGVCSSSPPLPSAPGSRSLGRRRVGRYQRVSELRPHKSLPNGSGPSRAEPSRAEPRRAEPRRAEPSRAGPSWAVLGRALSEALTTGYGGAAWRGRQSDGLHRELARLAAGLSGCLAAWQGLAECLTAGPVGWQAG